MKIIMYKYRNYRCRECGNKVMTGTNHEMDIYPDCQGKCRQIINPHTANEVVLRKQTAHKFLKHYEEKTL